MNTKMTVLWTAIFALLLQANSFAQVQWAGGGYATLDMATQFGSAQVAPGRFAQRAPNPGFSSVVPASFCADGPNCGVPLGISGDPCSGACGGVCSGGCGGSGLFKGAFGRALGLGGGIGSGLGGGLGSGGGGWLDVDYLLWWSKERYIPTLATQAPGTVPSNVAGQIGQASTEVIFGDSLIGGGPYSGVRTSGGRWLDSRQTLGLGGRFFYVDGTEDFHRSSDGDPVLARPFFDVSTGSQNALLVAYPGLSHGSINVEAENTAIGFDVFFRKLMLSGYCNRLDFIGGYHNSRIKDSVEIHNSAISDDPGRAPLGSEVATLDNFEVKNQFHGGFIGLMGTSEDGPLSWNLLAKIALGNMNQEATISGRTTSTVTGPGGGSFSNDIGLLALPTNIGSFDRDEFAVVPEVNLNMAYNVSNNFKLTIGYTFIYWSKVGLAGDLIDTTINSTQLTNNLVGEPRPRSSLKSDGFFYSGLNFGGSFRF